MNLHHGISSNNSFTQGLEGKIMKHCSGVRVRRKTRHTDSPGAVKKSDWNMCKDNELYGRNSLEKFGFIHCSGIKDIVEVANSNFVGIGDMVLLCIDTDKVVSEIKWEDLRNCGVSFPHIYGELNTNAIVAVIEFPQNEDGTFALPDELKDEKIRF